MDDSEGRGTSTDVDAGIPTVRYERSGERPATHLRTVVGTESDGETVAGADGVHRIADTQSAAGEPARWWTALGRGDATCTIKYRPYGPHGALVVLVGAIFALPTLFVSLLLSAVGYYLYRIQRPLEVPIVRVAVLEASAVGNGGRVADAGVAADRDAESTAANGTDEIAVSLEGGLAVDTGRLADLDWTQHKAVVTEVREWATRARGDGPHRETDDDVFFSHVNRWRERDAATSVDTVDEIQRRVFADREQRRAYTAFLRERPTGAPAPPDDTELEELRTRVPGSSRAC
ncbi:hypothetical protein OB905_11895 [Halobacteria archaeon AArc-dxtr1]|nr:hypothetical protein [Halobacteria archaeon AArc-dxtr1]